MEYCYRLMTKQYCYGFDPGWTYLSDIYDEDHAIRELREIFYYADRCEAALWSCSGDGRVNLIGAWRKAEFGEPKPVDLDSLEHVDDLTATKEVFDLCRPRPGDFAAWLTNQESP